LSVFDTSYFDEMIDFATKSKPFVGKVVMTIVSIDEVDIGKSKKKLLKKKLVLNLESENFLPRKVKLKLKTLSLLIVHYFSFFSQTNIATQNINQNQATGIRDLLSGIQ